MNDDPYARISRHLSILYDVVVWHGNSFRRRPASIACVFGTCHTAFPPFCVKCVASWDRPARTVSCLCRNVPVTAANAVGLDDADSRRPYSFTPKISSPTLIVFMTRPDLGPRHAQLHCLVCKSQTVIAVTLLVPIEQWGLCVCVCVCVCVYGE